MVATDDLTAVSVLPILVVDDRQENLNALDGVLEPLGYPLLMARSGHEALRLLLEHDVALILLDVRMPELDGVETARLIKGRARTRDVPIVFLTAANDEHRRHPPGLRSRARSTTCSSHSIPAPSLQGGRVR